MGKFCIFILLTKYISILLLIENSSNDYLNNRELLNIDEEIKKVRNLGNIRKKEKAIQKKNFSKHENFKINNISNLINKTLIEENKTFLLLGFDSFINNKNNISWSIYFKALNQIIPEKLTFNITYFIHLKKFEENKNKSIICLLDKYSTNNILRYNCILILKELGKKKSISRIKGNYNSFLFDNNSYKVILSPIGNKTIYNIQKEKADIYKKFIKDKNYLYLLNNGTLIIDNDKKILYIKNVKVINQNHISTKKSHTKNTKKRNIEGDYIFPFKDQLLDYKTKNVMCNLKTNNLNKTYNIDCYLKDSILTNINFAVGHGINDTNRNVFLIFNISNDIVNLEDNNIFFYRFDNGNFKSSSGLSGKNIAIIVILSVFALILISLVIVK